MSAPPGRIQNQESTRRPTATKAFFSNASGELMILMKKMFASIGGSVRPMTR